MSFTELSWNDPARIGPPEFKNFAGFYVCRIDMEMGSFLFTGRQKLFFIFRTRTKSHKIFQLLRSGFRRQTDLRLYNSGKSSPDHSGG